MSCKILVISHNCFSPTLNNGKTLEAIFADFDQTELSQLFFHEADTPDFEFCSNYYKISDTNILKRLLLVSRTCGKVVKNITHETLPVANEKCGIFQMLFKVLRKTKRLMNPFRDIMWSTGVWKTKELKEWLLESQIDIIFLSGGGNTFAYKVALYASELLNKPLALFFTDDFIMTAQKKNFFENIQINKLLVYYRKVIGVSKVRFCIGKLMAQHYSSFFNSHFEYIMNSIKLRPYQEYQNSQEIVLSYFGNLSINRWKMLIRLSTFLPQNASIDVYCISQPEPHILDLFTKHRIRFHNGVTGDELIAKMMASDILLHVESDDEYYRSYTTYSVSTKIPEYLITGRPVLGFGPPELASMKIISDNQIGMIIPSTESPEDISNQLQHLVKDYEYRKSLGEMGYEYATANFDNDKQSKAFRRKLIETCKLHH